MPPGQPVHRCVDCGLLHPCRAFNGDWLCVDCAPVDVEPVVMTDGGKRRDGDAEQNPLERLFVEDATERPDEIVVDELTTTMDADEFVERLESLAAAAEAVETMAQDLERLRETGLSDDDARDLIYGRNSSLAKRDIEAMFDAVDQLSDGRADRPVERLLSELSDLNLSETAELIDELNRLNQQYGGLNDD